MYDIKTNSATNHLIVFKNTTVPNGSAVHGDMRRRKAINA
jgi:hypothetical protein